MGGGWEGLDANYICICMSPILFVAQLDGAYNNIRDVWLESARKSFTKSKDRIWFTWKSTARFRFNNKSERFPSFPFWISCFWSYFFGGEGSFQNFQLPSASLRILSPTFQWVAPPSVLRRRVLSATCGTNIKAKHSVPIPAAPMPNLSIRIDDFHRIRDGWDKKNALL